MANGVILDTNCFSHVFSQLDQKHSDYASFLNWLVSGPGFLVYGGSKYMNELSESKKYLKIFRLLNSYNKAIICDSERVDFEMKRIITVVNDSRFDDPHLAAIVIVSKSRVICTGDERCMPFLKRKEIYCNQVNVPKFYTGDHCASLLSKRYVGDGHKLSKQNANVLNALIQENEL